MANKLFLVTVPLCFLGIFILEASAIPNYDGFISIAATFKQTTKDLRNVPALKCHCWDSMAWLADQLQGLSAELKKPTGQTAHYVQTVQNSCDHMIGGVELGAQVLNALKAIRTTAVKMIYGKPDIATCVQEYISGVNSLNQGVRGYWKKALR